MDLCIGNAKGVRALAREKQKNGGADARRKQNSDAVTVNHFIGAVNALISMSNERDKFSYVVECMHV